jgi:lysozyme
VRGGVPLLLAGALLLAVGCADGDDPPGTPDRSAGSSSASSETVSRATEPTTTPTTEGPAPPEKKRVRLRGIDASHHQGTIDWQAVAGDGIAFAYLKATEGTSYTDPTFAQHREQAQRQGLQVGGYHYFQLCSSGADQAAHFASVLGELDGDDLPPAIDLELAGSCTTPPPRAVLLAEVRAFLEEVAAATGKEPVVYLYPEFEAQLGFASELGDHRQWVRSLAGKPGRDWWIWQQTDSGSVDGIAGPVDVNVMWRVGR